MSDKPEDVKNYSLIVHCSMPQKREEVGEFMGMKVFADPGMPDDEIRFVLDGAIIKRVRLW